VLRERVGLQRWSAVVIGFGAVVFMLDPWSSLFRIESAMPLFSALCYALIPIINRHIGLSEHALTMGIYTTASYFVLMALTSLAIHALPAPATDNATLQGVFPPASSPSPGTQLSAQLELTFSSMRQNGFTCQQYFRERT